MRHRSFLFLLAAFAVGCSEYDPPPGADLVQPEGGAFEPGAAIRLDFSEPVDASSLRVRVWPNVRDIENEIVGGTEPIVDICQVDEACGEFSMSLSNSRRSAFLRFDGSLGEPGRPMIVDLQPGLSDDAGNETVAHSTWDIQFRTTGEANVEPVEFDDGIYIILAQVDQPLPAVLTLISHVRALPDGRFALAGAEGDEINGAPKNTHNPEDLVVDETPAGWTAYATGFITVTEDGRRLLESDAFDLVIRVGPLDIAMQQTRLFAELVKHPETGKDSFDGTLSFDALQLTNGANITDYEGSSTAFIANFIPEELIPAGHPVLCEDLCGAVIGKCEPPENFPDADFCTESD